MHYLFRDDATLPFASEQAQMASNCHCDIVVVMLGGNDIDNRVPIPFIIDAIQEAGEALCENENVRRVIFTSLWPRRDASFNRKIKDLDEKLDRYFEHGSKIAVWKWDRRQPTYTYDGVHLADNGYRRAANFLMAPIKWALKELRQQFNLGHR